MFGILAAGLAFKNTSSISTKYNRRLVKNLVLKGLTTLGGYWLATSVYNNIFESSQMV